MRLLLIQARDDRFMSEHERTCVSRAANVPAEHFKLVDARTEPLGADLLEDCDAVFIGGSGEYSVAAGAPFLPAMTEFLRQCVSRRVPTMGLCFGFHALALAFGAEVKTVETNAETGTFRIEKMTPATTDPLFSRMPETFYGHQGHNDSVLTLPPPLIPLARSQRCPYQACVVEGTPVYGIQFHPELRLDDLKTRLDYYGYLKTPEREALVRDNLHETPETERMIELFLDLFVPAARR